MKTTAAIVLISVGGAAAWSQPSRASLRSLGQKQVVMKGPSRVNGNTMKMEGALSFSIRLCQRSLVSRNCHVGIGKNKKNGMEDMRRLMEGRHGRQ